MRVLCEIKNQVGRNVSLFNIGRDREEIEIRDRLGIGIAIRDEDMDRDRLALAFFLLDPVTDADAHITRTD